MKIAIVFGGVSFEHEISIVSSIAMKDVLKNELIYLFFRCIKRYVYHIPTDIIKSKLFSSGDYKNLKSLFFFKKWFYKRWTFSKDKILILMLF